MPSDFKEIYQKAITLWGWDLQLNMAIEESSELIKAICKLKRNGASLETVNAVAEEIADVEIMIEQIKLMFDCRDDVEEWMAYKLERLSKMIKEAEKNNAN